LNHKELGKAWTVREQAGQSQGGEWTEFKIDGEEASPTPFELGFYSKGSGDPWGDRG
jgi:hypothetical protein